MRRRDFTASVLASAFWPVSSIAQNADRIRVGLLSLHSYEHERIGKIGASAFRAGMQALGYSEGRNFQLHERHADGEAARLLSLAVELIAERVDVIVAVGTDATHAAREVTSSVPIIMAGVGDPVRAGFVFSLPYPGGNITGTALLNPETVGKQLEMVKGSSSICRVFAGV